MFTGVRSGLHLLDPVKGNLYATRRNHMLPGLGQHFGVGTHLGIDGEVFTYLWPYSALEKYLYNLNINCSVNSLGNGFGHQLFESLLYLFAPDPSRGNVINWLYVSLKSTYFCFLFIAMFLLFKTM